MIQLLRSKYRVVCQVMGKIKGKDKKRKTKKHEARSKKDWMINVE
jgi:hypothetical protein